MAVRTDDAAVIALLAPGKDYDTDLAPSLTGFIASATVVVDRVKTCAAAKGVTLTTAELELIERWLSAHLYAMTDQTTASKSTEGASASFHGQTGMNLEATKYGQSALLVDFSGCLAAISKRQVARGVWLGKAVPDQLSWEDRN